MEILGHIFFSGDSNIVDQLQRIEIYTEYSGRSELLAGVVSSNNQKCGVVAISPVIKNTKHPSGSNSLNR